MHQYRMELFDDGDYIVFGSWYHCVEGHVFIEHTRWLIPGTQLEDE